MTSISFDRAAEIYDQTRSHPPGITQSAAERLASRLPPNARLLEIGVGTGRIALPLQAVGLRMTGLDISRRMMERLLTKLEGQAPPALMEASALDLPLVSGSFEAVVGVHVLHLIPGWQRVLGETHRVLKPGGTLALGYDWHPEDCPSSLLRARWDELINAQGVESHPVLRSFEEVTDWLRQSGAQHEELVGAEWSRSFTLQNELDRLQSRAWSATWHIPETVFAPAMAELTGWAAARFGSLDQPCQSFRRFIWQLFRWEASSPTDRVTGGE